MKTEFDSRKTKDDRREGEERRKTPCFIDKDRRKDNQRSQNRRGKAQKLINQKNRKEFERHLKAQR